MNENSKRIAQKYAYRVYDPILLDEYYALTNERTTQAASREIIEAVGKMKYDREEDDERRLSISDFHIGETSLKSWRV